MEAGKKIGVRGVLVKTGFGQGLLQDDGLMWQLRRTNRILLRRYTGSCKMDIKGRK